MKAVSSINQGEEAKNVVNRDNDVQLYEVLYEPLATRQFKKQKYDIRLILKRGEVTLAYWYIVMFRKTWEIDSDKCEAVSDDPLKFAVDVRKLSTWAEPDSTFPPILKEAAITAIVEAVKIGELIPI